MNHLSLATLAFLVLALTNVTHARGGEGGMRGGGDFGGGEFRGDDEFRDDTVDDGGFRGEAPRLDGNFDPAVRDDANIQRTGDDSYRINADGDTATVRGDGDGVANVNVRTVNGVNY
ncbi:MAG: hypothetical protein ACKOAL_06375, partial [Chthoniobacterales bacterium]